jgi:TatD DNase family protein
MPLPVDSHCHLTDIANINTCLKESKEKLACVFTCGYSKETSLFCLQLAQENPGFVYAVAGESPQRVMDRPDPDIEWLRRLSGIVAIGEIGLDKHWGKTEAQLENQKKWFSAQLALAQERNLPVVIHSRDAESDVIDILERTDAGRVLLHCFSGKPEEAKRGEDLGYSITVAPGRSKQRRKIIKAVELDYILLESDAPYLGRDPSSVVEPAKLVSEEKAVELQEAIEITAKNSLKFYGVR